MFTLKKIIIFILSISISSTLYARGIQGCIACHGRQGQHNTMVPQSKPNTMTKSEIIAALQGYRAGTLDKYQRAKLIYTYKKKLTDKEIKKIAKLWGK